MRKLQMTADCCGLILARRALAGFRIDQMRPLAERALHRNADRIGTDQAFVYECLHLAAGYRALKGQRAHRASVMEQPPKLYDESQERADDRRARI